MSNRVSISFAYGWKESIALLDHWGGMERVEHARNYARGLRRLYKSRSGVYPLERLEPGTVMVDYIRVITENRGPVLGGLSIGYRTEGDNSDNGHYVIRLDEGGDKPGSDPAQW